ncbi:MAG: hypothetical protein ABI678_33675 [Kofleriaceae bacterium]
MTVPNQDIVALPHVPTVEETRERSLDKLRDSLTEKLGELHRRAVHAKQVVTPATYFENPWTQLGLALVAGIVVGDQMKRGGLFGTLALLGLGAAAYRAFEPKAITSSSEPAPSPPDEPSPAP